MRNFPHQVNQIRKIKGALQVVSQLATEGHDVGDDGVLGYAVARAGIYTFRNLPNPSSQELEDAVQREQVKPPSNQGPRTFARDLRRTLFLLGFLEHLETSDWRVTDSGQRVLDIPDPPEPEATALWTDAVVNLSLADPSLGDIIHPAQNMLRTVAHRPGVEKRWLAFALDMRDDSNAELDRVLALQRLPFEAALESVGAGKYMAANAVKILPSLLEQLGLMSIQGGACTLTPSGLALMRATQVPSIEHRLIMRQARRGRTVAESADIPEHPLIPTGQVRGTEDQLHSAALLEERTSQHQQLVRRIVNLLRISGQVSEIRVSDDAFDVLALSSVRPEVLLIEAKTLRDDALIQARIALGQLLFYEFFDIRPIAEGHPIRKIVAFDSEPSQQAREFLAAYEVACLVSRQDTLQVPAGFEEYFGSM
jgi:hypothetical protein